MAATVGTTEGMRGASKVRSVGDIVLGVVKDLAKRGIGFQYEPWEANILDENLDS